MTCSGNAQHPANVFFLSITFQKAIECFGTRFCYVKKYKLFIIVFTTIHWVKPAWTAVPTLFTSRLLMGRPAGQHRQSLLVFE